MSLLLMFVAFLLLGLCLSDGKSQRRQFLGGVLALLYLPVGILLALTKKYK